MDDLTNSNNQTSDSNRLRLKKVKRPVNRTMPQSPAMPSATGQTQQNAQVPFNRPQGEATPSTGQNPFVQQRPQMPQSPSPTISSEGNEIRPQTAPVNSFHQSRAAAAPEQSASEEIDFNIDNYLDADENLPSLNKVPTDYNGGKNPQFIDEDDLDEAQAYGSDLPPYLTKRFSPWSRWLSFYGNRHFPAYFCGTKNRSGRVTGRRGKSRSADGTCPLRRCRKNARLRLIFDESATARFECPRFL